MVVNYNKWILIIGFLAIWSIGIGCSEDKAASIHKKEDYDIDAKFFFEKEYFIVKLIIRNQTSEVFEVETMKGGVFSPIQVLDANKIIAQEDFKNVIVPSLHGFKIEPLQVKTVKIRCKLLQPISQNKSNLVVRFTLGIGEEIRMHRIKIRKEK